MNKSNSLTRELQAASVNPKSYSPQQMRVGTLISESLSVTGYHCPIALDPFMQPSTEVISIFRQQYKVAYFEAVCSRNFFFSA
ncbi:hypothetical protein ACFLX8_01720 [Chloroflexota bacterium]